MPPARLRPAASVSLERARAHWIDRQGLAAPADDAPAAVLSRTGWLRTLGGADVYIAARARIAGLTRDALDAAPIMVVPAVRGCIYFVPREDVPLALRLADDLSARRNARELARVGIDDAELADVGAAVLEAIRGGPLTTPQLRQAMPDGVVRSLGEVGKKVGISSPLPPALRRLELDGRIERIPMALDSERYRWRRTAVSPFEGADVADEPVLRIAQAAARFFRWAGPATLDQLVDWVGCGKRDAARAIEGLPVVGVEIEDHAEAAWVLEDQLEALQSAEPSAGLAFLPFEDNALVLHGGPGPFTDPAYHDQPVPAWGMGRREIPLGEARHIHRRPLMQGDRMIGFWEFDPDAKAIVTRTFDGTRPRGIVGQAKALATWLSHEVGHGRAYSLDTDDALRERAAALRG